MKKRLIALLCALTLLLTACVKEEETLPPEGAYKVYFAVAGEAAATKTVDFEYHVPPGGGTAEELLKLLLAEPQTIGLATPFLPGVRLNAAALDEEGTLHVDLSEQYNGLPGVYLTVANACIVLTLSQLSGVNAVYITVEGKPLPYQTVQPLHNSDLLLSSAEEESLNVNAVLYFPRTAGESLGVEHRTVIKTEVNSLPAAILSALLAGPEGEGLTACFPEGTAIRSVRAENGLCKLDLSGEFLLVAPEEGVSARLNLYAIVNTLCAIGELKIASVQLYVEGQPLESYGDLPTLAPLEPDYNLTR